jgi:hypothetical protein
MVFKKAQQELTVYRFIDAYIDLYGELKIPIIAKQFQIHRSKACVIMMKYKQKKPSNLDYDVKKQKYFKKDGFKKIFLANESSFLYLYAIDLIFSR